MYKGFIDDEEKMRDFFFLTKEEFLKSYSYLTEEEYDLTDKTVKNMTTKEYVQHFMPHGRLAPIATQLDKDELIGQIIDTFEDFLDDHHVVIENPERDFNAELDEENSANIYGSDYDELSTKLEKTLKGWHILPNN